MKFDVFLPSLLVSPDWFADSAPPCLPALETLLAHGCAQIVDEWPMPLLTAFGVNDAIAAISAYGDSIETDAAGWMFAEPAHFQADRDTVNLFPASRLEISADEAAVLIDALNTNFADRGLSFSCGKSGYWYVRCNPQELPQTTSIRAAQRGAVFEKLPRSTGKLSWKAIQNEAQMLFHSHAVNEQREADGKLSINGLWFWGEGVLPNMPVGGKSSISAVFGDTALANGLAKFCNARFTPLKQLNVLHDRSPADHIVLIPEALAYFHERGDIKSWRDAAVKMDTQIFSPLLTSLRTGEIDEVNLTLSRNRDSVMVTITAQSLRGISGWWNQLTKRPRPFLESARG